MNKPIILFGAGVRGQNILHEMKNEQIEYIVDNDSKKVGMEYFGVPVISFEQLLKIYKNYQIIISSSYEKDISNQLKNHGITEFQIHGNYSMEMIRAALEVCRKFKSVALYGVDSCIPVLLEMAMELGVKDNIHYIVDENKVGKKIHGFTVKKIDEILNDVDAVLVTTSKENSVVMLRLSYYKNIKIFNLFDRVKFYNTEMVVINTNNIDSTNKRTEDEWIQSNAQNPNIIYTNNYVKEINKHETIPLFQVIEIETINCCNGTCSFCPVNVNRDIREKKYMEIEMFETIILELESIGYNGKISLYSNNEPLLDTRILELSKYVRKKLPGAMIHMYTNGTLLTVEIFKELIEFLDELIIDNYNKHLKLIPTIERIKNYIDEHSELAMKTSIVIRNPDEVLTSRGGEAPNRTQLISYSEHSCALPFQQMVIRPDGKVSLCCNDPYGKMTLGDIKQNSLLDIWNGKEYQKVREALRKGRSNLQHCKYCDTFIVY